MMEKKKTPSPYMNMAIGSIGILLLAFGILKNMALVGNTTSFLLTFLGFLIMVHYIYHLEKKAGINNKLIWIRAGILIIAVLAFGLITY